MNLLFILALMVIKELKIADIILPGSAYTEQDGYYTNLEGKIQKAYKASYPPGDC